MYTIYYTEKVAGEPGTVLEEQVIMYHTLVAAFKFITARSEEWSSFKLIKNNN